MLAKELLNKPDSFITATYEGKELIIKNIKIVATHANKDDVTTHLTITLRDGGNGNIKR